MKKWNHKLLFVLAGLIAAGTMQKTVAACTFSWHHYGDASVYKRLEKVIGSKVTSEYCQKYNGKYEIFISTNHYMTTESSLGHAIVGLRKRESKDYPTVNTAGYSYKLGNFAVSVSYDLAVDSAMNALVDLMSDLDTYAK